MDRDSKPCTLNQVRARASSDVLIEVSVPEP